MRDMNSIKFVLSSDLSKHINTLNAHLLFTKSIKAINLFAFIILNMEFSVDEQYK
jgi:hypothetical protein